MPTRKLIDYPHRSISQLTEHARCPRHFYFHRVLGLPTGRVYNMEAGKAIHAGLEEHNRERARGRKGLTREQMIDCAVAAMERIEEQDELDMPFRKAVDKLANEDGPPPLSRYLGITERREMAEAPASEDDVERLIEFEFAGVKFVGYVDDVLSDRVVDYKFLARKKSAGQVLFDPQLILYKRVLKKPKAAFVELLKGKNVADYTPQNTSEEVENGVLGWIENRVRAIEACEKTGNWPMCEPGSWMCKSSTGQCPFYSRCYGKAKVTV